MRYCGNCGKENTKKICPHCGHKSQKVKRFCVWCGEALDGDAVICTACHERLKDSFGTKIKRGLGLLLGLVLIGYGVAFIVEGAFLTGLFLATSGIMLLPAVKAKIRLITFGKPSVRKIVNLVRRIAVIVLFISAFNVLPDTGPIEYKVYKDDATEKAVSIFHDEVKLKNEASFVLNDSTVTYSYGYDGDEDLALVVVVLDYSAQNGFGGTGRDTYTVELVFNRNTGFYRNAN